MRLVVLSDLNPAKFPGAASIAFGLAQEAKKEHDVEFWCADSKGGQSSDPDEVANRIREISDNRIQKMEGNLLQRFYFEILGFRECYWLYRQIKAFQPTHVWIHQIGSRFPKSIIPLLKFLKIPVVVTIHDFSLIFNRKLYPADINFSDDQTSLSLIERMNVGFYLSAQKDERRLLLNIRRKIVLFFYSFADQIICISGLQASVLKKIGLKVNGVLPNGTKKCNCKFDSRFGDSKFNILFAGRPNAKGLELLLEATKRNTDAHLHLAGGLRLVELAQEILENDRFTYHGLLNADEIAKLLHQVQLVSVLSQCFDVYPTITIEALSHKIPVITTNLTGNSNLVSKLSDSLVINYGQIPDLKQVQEVLRNSKLIFPEVITIKDSWKSYKLIFNQTS